VANDPASSRPASKHGGKRPGAGARVPARAEARVRLQRRTVNQLIKGQRNRGAILQNELPVRRLGGRFGVLLPATAQDIGTCGVSCTTSVQDRTAVGISQIRGARENAKTNG